MSERRVIVIGNHPKFYGQKGTLQHDLHRPGKNNVVNLDNFAGIAPCFITEELILESQFTGELPEAVTVVLQDSVDTTPAPVLPKPTPGKRGRKKTTLDITPELVDAAIVLVKSGKGGVLAAKELNVNPQELLKALKGAGVELKRGRKPGSTKATEEVAEAGELVPA
jgi:hypothetical protein